MSIGPLPAMCIVELLWLTLTMACGLHTLPRAVNIDVAIAMLWAVGPAITGLMTIPWALLRTCEQTMHGLLYRTRELKAYMRAKLNALVWCVRLMIWVVGGAYRRMMLTLTLPSLLVGVWEVEAD